MQQGHVEVSPKRVRGVVAGHVVADSTRVLLVWERAHHPAYYFPRADVRTDLIVPNDGTMPWDAVGEAHLADLQVGDRVVPDAVLTFPDSPIKQIADHVRFRWKAMDAWLEEDEPVFVHPHDPYTRIDILSSSRRVRVEINGVTVADSTRTLMLFETATPTRCYLPRTDVRFDLLEPGTRTSRCPYKGTAEYFSVRIGDAVHHDVAWTYRTPFAESGKIAGYIAFDDEMADVTVEPPLRRPREVAKGHPRRA